MAGATVFGAALGAVRWRFDSLRGAVAAHLIVDVAIFGYVGMRRVVFVA